MDLDRQRIEQDLRGQVSGEVLCDALTAHLYAGDASIYEQAPTAVVRPRNTEDVVAVLRYASRHSLPVHARGAGSGLAGGAIGPGLVVDFSRFMRRVVSVGDETARVQPGVVHAELNRLLAGRGRVFGPDPMTSEVTTIGGVLGVNASGAHWPWYGAARDNVRSLKAVLSDGEVLELGPLTLDELDATHPAALRRLVAGVSSLAHRHRHVLEAHPTQALVNASGYALDHALAGEDHVDLAKLLVGSEGTLALIVEAELATRPLPAATGRVLLMFDSLEKAVRAATEVAPLGPSACDLLDRRHVSVARETDVRYDLIIPAAAEAVLLVEFFGDDQSEVDAKVDAAVRVARDDLALAAGAFVSEEQEDHRLLEQIPRRFTETLHGMKGRRRAAPCVEDIAVPPEALPVFMRHLQDVLKRQQVTSALFAHAAHGQVRLRPLLDLRTAEDARRMELLASELYEKVWLLGGVVSGSLGDGLSRTPFLRRQHGPLINVFRELKRLFDPAGVLNPGKIVPAPGARMTQGLRFATPGRDAASSNSSSSAPVELQLSWTAEEMAAAAWTCNGCGACRTRAPAERMCPIFHFAPREEASPRAKANLARGVLTGALPHDQFTRDAAKAVADLCVHCHQCRLECPANVDVPKLMLEAKAEHVLQNGLRPRDWCFAHIDTVSAWAARFPRLANWALADPRWRWVLDKTMGLAQGRRLPRVAARPFLCGPARRLQAPVRGAVEKVVYFVDTYANYFDGQLADALVRVLEHNGVGVHAPTSQGHSAMAMISQGALPTARRVAARNVEALSELVRQGHAIVATEPSAALALSHEYPMLLEEDEDAQLVAENTFEACDYLWRLHQRGRLKLDFRPAPYHVAYHVPCHVRALERGAPAGNLLRLIPQLRLAELEKGCSGMAGVYGLKRENYRRSLRAGLPLLTELRSGGYDIAVSECSTCAVQMRQTMPTSTLHPLKIVAMSYGLLPALEAELADKRIEGAEA